MPTIAKFDAPVHAAIPVDLHGALVFHGTASGPILNLNVKGHLEGDQMQVKLGTAANIQVDSVVADADYSPRGLSVASSTIKQGAAVLHVGADGSPAARDRHRRCFRSAAAPARPDQRR